MKNKVALHFDKPYFTNQLTWLQSQAVKLNATVGRIEKAAGVEFDDKEKKEIKSNPKLFVETWIKRIAPFQNSSIEFNLEALGWHHYTPLLRDLDGVFFMENLSLVNGKFEVSKEEMDRLKESTTIYAKNDLEVKKHDLLIKTIDLLEEMIDLHLINVYSRAAIAQYITGIGVGVREGENEYKFIFKGTEICDL
jgi:hypothetical protein